MSGRPKNRLGVFGWGETPLPAVAKQVRQMQEQLHGFGDLLRAEHLASVPVFCDGDCDGGGDGDGDALPTPRFTLDAAPGAVRRLCSSAADARRRHALGKSARDEFRALRFSAAVAAGDANVPDYVASPTTQAEVQLLLRWFSHAGAGHGHGGVPVAVVTKGGGTSVTGGLEIPGADAGVGTGAGGAGRRRCRYAGVVSLDVSGLDRILSVDECDQTVRVECGVTGPQLNEYLRLRHPALCFRHYPQSYEFATVGGMIVTRSGGHYATGSTRIDDFVQTCTMVAPNGAVVEAAPIPRSGSGVDVNRAVMCGGEGIFGVVTSAVIKLVKRPVSTHAVTLTFPDWDDAVTCVRELVQAGGLQPAQCRLISGAEAVLNRIVKPNEFSHVLLLGFEAGLDVDWAPQVDACIRLATGSFGAKVVQETVRRPSSAASGGGGNAAKLGIGGSGSDVAQSWSDSFLAMPYFRDLLPRAGVIGETFETVVTWRRFGGMHAALQREFDRVITEAFGVDCFRLITCRFTHVYTDGPAPYYTTVIRPMERQPPERLLVGWDAVKRALSNVLRQHGAAATHHHAVGTDHAAHFRAEVGEATLAYLRAVKRHFDPRWILNPGVMLEVPLRDCDSDGCATSGRECQGSGEVAGGGGTEQVHSKL